MGGMPERPPTRTVPIHQLKVTLRNIKPPIWRTLQVRSDMTLAELHEVLQVAFGWSDYHLHQFIAAGVTYGIEDPDWPMGVEDENAVTLAEVLPEVKSKMIYEYDFGDDWRHEIVLQKILEPEAGVSYPVCIKGKRNAPPEDSGGWPGYDNMLAALADPGHAEHAEYLEWVGGSFDPEAFSLEEINEALAGSN
jgi:hypothetical protein